MKTDLELLQQMLEIRAFENQIQSLFSAGQVRGTTHLAQGQEATAVGAADALTSSDAMLCTYRGHHHSLARGIEQWVAFAELLGRVDGCCGGKGGSMHLGDPSIGHFGSYAIIGSHIPMATGVAWAMKMSREEAVTICWFGDGTTTIGSFHEALNLAALWKLPIVFACENNFYSEYTPIHNVVPVENPAADRAPAYGLESIVIDGNDVHAVRSAVAQARASAVAGDGPTLIEMQTYRHGGHSRADPAKYRPQEEVDYWMQRDPVLLLARRMGMSDADLARQTERADHLAKEASERALASPEPSLESLHTNVWGS